MNTKKQPKEPDFSLIRQLGGPTQVARKLGYKVPGSVQRVANWQWRGIPSSVKVQHPDLFLPHLVKKRVPESV